MPSAQDHRPPSIDEPTIERLLDWPAQLGPRPANRVVAHVLGVHRSTVAKRLRRAADARARRESGNPAAAVSDDVS